MTGPEPFGRLGWLLTMAQAATREQAQECANEGLRLGATPAELAEAWTEWDRLHDEQVQRIGGRP